MFRPGQAACTDCNLTPNAACANCGHTLGFLTPENETKAMGGRPFNAPEIPSCPFCGSNKARYIPPGATLKSCADGDCGHPEHD
jgi:rubredoxin